MGGAAGIEQWKKEVERPTEGFFKAFAERGVEDPRGATCEALEILVPAVNWAGYLPHVPHGLLGTWAAWALLPRLSEASFLRMLATLVTLHKIFSVERTGCNAGITCEHGMSKLMRHRNCIIMVDDRHFLAIGGSVGEEPADVSVRSIPIIEHT